MSRFPKTDWSLIDLASVESWSGSRERIGQLIEQYRQPMYVHLRSRGMKHEQAEDLLQEFFVDFLNGKLLTAADPEKGKFRTLLLTALNRFAVGKKRYETAAKRSPGELASLDSSEAIEASTQPVDPSMVFERAWALDVLAHTLAQMYEECETDGQMNRWSVFQSRVIGPLLEGTPPPGYRDLAEEYGLKDEKAAMNLLVTGKRQFDRILTAIVRVYITRGTDVDQQKKDVARKLETGEADAPTAMRVAEQVVEQNIRRRVQEEINQLGEILGRSHSIADQIRLPYGSASNVSERKLFFWQKLADIQTPDTISGLYSGDAGSSDENDDSLPMDFYFSVAIDTKLTDLPNSQTQVTSTIRDCLMSREPDVETLRFVKDWANVLRTSRDHELPADVVSSIYFLTIATALVHCNEQITELSPIAMKTGFNWLSGQDWLPEEIQPVVAQAITLLA